jgi:hypothetical protein
MAMMDAPRNGRSRRTVQLLRACESKDPLRSRLLDSSVFTPGSDG